MRKTQSDLPNPGMCIICRQTRVYGEEHMIETGALIDFGVATPVNGEVLVCSSCVGELAEASGGYVKEADVERERANYRLAREELAEFRQMASEAADRIDSVMNRAEQVDLRLAQREAEQEGRA
jgi:hypothetical protein